MPEKLRVILHELRRCLEEIYGERLARLMLFGFQARGDAGPDSYIDVLVVLKGPVDPGEETFRTGQAVSDLSLEHDVVILCFYVPEEEFLIRQGPLLRNIRREGVAV
ncbi:MAG: nucleotidyltransferase domain-containing protein [Acidobacteriota bacterium]